MFKVSLVVLLAVAGACAQNLPAGPLGGEAAPEPYSYGYETETHSASEQKDPNGKVTGYYTLSDADGRSRRVEYYADESGFHAKVQTNEVGTESKNSADVEVLASPPTREQLVYQPPAAQPQPPPQPQPQRAFSAQQTFASQPARAFNSFQQPGYAQYGSQYGYGYGYNPAYGYANSQYGYASPSYGYGSAAYGVNGAYGSGHSSYNSQSPSGYYRSVQKSSSVGVQPSSYSSSVGVQPVAYTSSVGVQPSAYSSGGVVSRYSVTNPAVGVVGPVGGVGQVGAVGGSSGSSYRSSESYQTVGVPTGVRYQSSVVGPQRVSYSSSVGNGYSSSNPLGSSNYIVLKKRDADQTAANAASKLV